MALRCWRIQNIFAINYFNIINLFLVKMLTHWQWKNKI